MKKEAFEWYAKRDLEAHKQIEQGAKFGLSKDQVISAMEHCYNKIVNEGKKVPDNQISWYVRNVAKDIDPTSILSDHERIEKAENETEKQKQLFKSLSLDHEKLKKSLDKEARSKAEILNKLNAYKDKAKKEIKSLEERMTLLGVNHLADIGTLREDYKKVMAEKNTEIESLHNRYSSKFNQLDAAKQKLEKEIKSLEERMISLDTKHLADIKILRNRYSSKFDRLETAKQRLEKELKKANQDIKFLVENGEVAASQQLQILEGKKRNYKRLVTAVYILTILTLSHMGFWIL